MVFRAWDSMEKVSGAPPVKTSTSQLFRESVSSPRNPAEMATCSAQVESHLFNFSMTVADASGCPCIMVLLSGRSGTPCLLVASLRSSFGMTYKNISPMSYPKSNISWNHPLPFTLLREGAGSRWTANAFWYPAGMPEAPIVDQHAKDVPQTFGVDQQMSSALLVGVADARTFEQHAANTSQPCKYQAEDCEKLIKARIPFRDMLCPAQTSGWVYSWRHTVLDER